LSGRLSWERDGRDWPHREASRFVEAAALRWHVQVIGLGPVLLLLHGTGASTHSWRGLIPLLAPHFTVVAPDLPGHGFTATPKSGAGYSLPGVAAGLAALLARLDLAPTLVAGHSAGAAIAVRMTLDGSIAPSAVVSLNGALLPFPGMANGYFSSVARVLAMSPITARAFTFFVRGPTSVEKLLRGTGSRIDAEGMRLYARLAGTPSHVAGALGLMANWDLAPLVRDLPKLSTRFILVTGAGDTMVPPSEAYRVRSLFPRAEMISLPGLGHLAHEEQPEQIAALLLRLRETANAA
jgi:magnesium chelatase accessory protein